MLLLFSLLVRIALGQTPAPTNPTARPTITPAPESKCLYLDTENGPFALDCLQDEFIKIGCSVRGDSYPTETRQDTEDDDPEADKEWYNANTWADVLTRLQAVKDADGNDCNGNASDQPSPSPTLEPTTKSPTPSPSIPPTSLTPAPTFSEDYGLASMYTNDGSETADEATTRAAVKQACEDAGYARQYDMTQYVIALVMDGKTDYFTFVPEAQDTGFPKSICDMLGDPETNGVLFSDKIDGPFIAIDYCSDTPTMYDSRVYPSWANCQGGAGGYGGVAGAAAGGKAYEIQITSLRSYSTCRERVVPQTTSVGDSPVFDDANTHCKRGGTSLQDWTSSAVVCEGADSTALHYALANRMFSTCDDFCVYSPDYADDKANNEYWFWVAGSNCWKSRAQYTGGAFQECDTTHTDFTEERATAYAHVEKRVAMLCNERCDYVGGWIYAEGSCYLAVAQATYAGTAGSNNAEKAQAYCSTTYTGGNLASIADKAEQNAAVAVCDNSVCYIGNNPATKGTAQGDWRDGSLISYVNFWNGKESESSPDGDYLTLETDGSWKYGDGEENYRALCEMPADNDEAESNEANARACVVDDQDHDETKVPTLNIAESGFTDKTNPGDLHFIVNVPQQMYDAKIAFEDSTNDAGEYHYSYTTAYWQQTTAATACNEDNIYEGAIPWTVFNLGGAGGVKRMATWTDEQGTVQTTDDSEEDDGSNAKYIFGSVMRVEARMPVRTQIDTAIDANNHKKRVASFDRQVTVRIPFVLQFQKTVTVTTEVDIVSTKFNYKTVAAIIQSIQYETQYFQPPYAKVMLQIRTKSQYPYLFNKDESTIKLYPNMGDEKSFNVNMTIEWLQDDTNCTFTNPDHMREGDVCTQEWMLYLTPNDNVCYATGEYTIEYTAGCFYGKDVCYLPFDNNGNEITTVSFTFKIQTSKFCPQIADEVDLSGTLSVTGRQSFKPDEEGVEDDTEGSMYFQGEKIHLFATTASQKAKITSTKVVMVEVEQDMSELVQTGYNRIPYDASSADMTVWTEDVAGRVADGQVNIDDGTDMTPVTLMQDSEVYPSGTDFGDYSFSATEAGFKILLHARAFPVNVDSFGTKKILATLEVTYEALGVTRRRLLAADPQTDLRMKTDMRLNAFRGESKPNGLGQTASMSLYMTLQANVNRQNVKAFADSFRDAVVSGLNDSPQSTKTVYETQVAVDAVWTDGSRIWSRPRDHRFGSRRLLEVAPTQKIRVDFTFAAVNYANAMDLPSMINMFYQQLKQPASTLMHQNIFYGSVIHKCIKAPRSEYLPPASFDGPPGVRDSNLESSAFVAAPFALFSLLLALLW